ncbi:sensor histidine kinase [Paenibacillus hexagrammi]|uniref:ATP-binding protein n=1 Tax=Paenibacillus hexagrammi TaxID=2908839 RepID=A0ABY3SSR7_9BACL|nr:ATP-binding protein [Paenibacillus sp. YPD9-1]UJF36061.1 ATP-binding protein [Paenibacillus sp. YPD9-1]
MQDTGQGMSEEQLSRLLSESGSTAYRGHSTGIGLSNVIHRLQLFFGLKDIIDIDSNAGEGTCITLKLPKLSRRFEA